ncbi:MAG: uracil-DNA glycosylase family protein [Actinomycetota bacterium]
MPDPAVTKAAGELMAIWAEVAECESCPRCSASDRVYGTGHPRAPIMLVKESPSDEDLEMTNAFASDADALTKAFDALGIPLSWLYGTTAVRCGTEPATTDDVAACSVHLLGEIEAVGPRVIVAFGPRAADAVRALDGRCGISIPEDLPQAGSSRIRSDLVLLITESLPEGLTGKEAKRRLWRDLQALPGLLAEGA